MTKLKRKIFITLTIILSFCCLTILSIFLFQNYNNAKMNIERNLNSMDHKDDMKDKNNLGQNKPPQDEMKIFMDTSIYTIKLDQNNEITNIINHSKDNIINDDIEQIALNITKNNNNNITYIGNLYFNKYSYKYEKNNLIIIIDNTDTIKRLQDNLKISILLFVLLFILILLISNILSKWLIKPVEASFKKQKQFIADASHELKTPLAIIMASEEAYEKDKNKKWLQNIKNESDRMNNLIKDLLDLAKLENDSKKIYEKNNLSKLVEKTALTFESLCYEKKIKLNYDIEKNVFYKCNSEEIKQVIGIILENAIKYSKGIIDINMYTDKKNIILKIKNNGEPIKKGEEEKIFERFYRIDKSRTRSENHYGLGLAIAKNIVEKYKGIIKASNEDNYATFTILLKKEH